MKRKIFAVISAFSLWTGATHAVPESHAFDVSVFGFKAGVMSVALEQTGSGYIARGRLTNKGLLAKLAKLEFDGTVSGTVKGNTLVPREYSATIAKKNVTNQVRISYTNKVPKVLEYSPTRAPRETDVDAAKQKGAVDLISATYMIVSDTKIDDLCNKTVQMFDGRRRSKIEMAAPKLDNGGATCAGAYTRIGGFSKRDLEKGSRFPFKAYYEMQDDGTYRLMRVSTKSIVGSAWLHRRN
jgi:hypothetical protein